MKNLALTMFVWLSIGATGYSADFFCASGNTGCLISAIDVANGNGQDNSIFLEAGEYTLRAVNNGTEGSNGLPVITGRLRILGPEGIGSTIERDPTAPFFRLFEIASSGNVVLDWLGLRGGLMEPQSGVAVQTCGGAIYNKGNLTINRSAVYKNGTMLIAGGAICSVGTLSISNSEFYSNIAGANGGGAIYSSGSLVVEDALIAGNSAEEGAGILSSGTGILLRSTVSHNQADSAAIRVGGTFWIEESSVSDNGLTGIFNSSSGTLTIVNSTVFHTSGSTVGGIMNSGSLSLKNVNIVGNKAFGIFNTGTARLQNSILALNGGGTSNCQPISSLGNNIFDALIGCSVVPRNSDIVGDPGLGSFTEDALVHGTGHTPLLQGSPAIDHGNDGACTPSDQLGERRIGVCDIGAVEFHPRKPARRE